MALLALLLQLLGKLIFYRGSRKFLSVVIGKTQNSAAAYMDNCNPTNT